MDDYIMMRTQISLTDDDRAVLDAEAARTGRSLSSLIREAVQRSYGFRRDLEQDVHAINAACGAWSERDVDGKTYVDGLRCGDRVRGGR